MNNTLGSVIGNEKIKEAIQAAKALASSYNGYAIGCRMQERLEDFRVGADINLKITDWFKATDDFGYYQKTAVLAALSFFTYWRTDRMSYVMSQYISDEDLFQRVSKTDFSKETFKINFLWSDDELGESIEKGGGRFWKSEKMRIVA